MTEPNSQPENTKKQVHRPRWLRRLAIAGVAVALLLVAVELFARFYLGLGDPPLSMADPEIEYLFKPSRTYHRLGNVIHYNAYSMRSEDFPAKKTDPAEFRVMVLGDSVVNGGVLTPQSRLATSLLQNSLAKDLHRKVIVGNISAGSWGPPNELAYAKRFGIFDADVVVIVVSSHDYADAPTFEPIVDISPDSPGHSPWCATWEAVTRYLPRYLPGRSAKPTTQPAPSQKDIDWCLASTREMVELARSRGAMAIGVLHLDQAESGGNLKPGHDALKGVFEACHVPVVELGTTFRAAIKSGKQPYRDNIHPNELGQELMAEALRAPIEQAAAEAKSPAATRPSDGK